MPLRRPVSSASLRLFLGTRLPLGVVDIGGRSDFELCALEVYREIFDVTALGPRYFSLGSSAWSLLTGSH